MLIGDHTVEGLVDGGAYCSILPYSMVKDMHLDDLIEPTTSRIGFDGGTEEVPVGCIKVDLTFHPDITINHRFIVVDNPFTPLLLGYDFLYNAKVAVNPSKGVITFDMMGDGSTMVDIETHVAGVSTSKEGTTNEDHTSTTVQAHFVGYMKDIAKQADVVIDSDVVLDPGEIMIAQLSLNEPKGGIGEYTVLESKPMGKHEIILWPSRIRMDGNTTMCIGNRGSSRIGIRSGSGDIIAATRNMSTPPTCINDVSEVINQLERLVTYPDMLSPTADILTR